MEEYKDLLQEGLRERVARRLEHYSKDMPSELADIPMERIIYNVTDIGIGKLNSVIDTVIDASMLTFMDLIRYSRNNEH